MAAAVNSTEGHIEMLRGRLRYRELKRELSRYLKRFVIVGSVVQSFERPSEKVLMM